MPVLLPPDYPDTDSSAFPGVRNRHSPVQATDASRPLVIGLLNNMPDGALEATERQFIALLRSAATEFTVRLVLCSLPGVPRGDAAAAHLQRYYVCIESLWNAGLDGLIVTGREPLSPSLRDEPYWDSFVRVLEWAREKTCASVWSCLAAHAAVLHMDGIQRVRSEQKYSGIFDCERIADHAIMAGVQRHFRVPHSRWNGLPEEALLRSGYQVLARAGDAGVDCFARQAGSLFLFFQGHPEYQPDTLLLEYRRDVLRFLRGETATWPGTPRGYLQAGDENRLLELQREAAGRSEEETISRVTKLFSAKSTENGWHANAAILYRNWLTYISGERERRLEKKEPVAAAAADPAGPQSLENGILCLREGMRADRGILSQSS